MIKWGGLLQEQKPPHYVQSSALHSPWDKLHFVQGLRAKRFILEGIAQNPLHVLLWMAGITSFFGKTAAHLAGDLQAMGWKVLAQTKTPSGSEKCFAFLTVF